MVPSPSPSLDTQGKDKFEPPAPPLDSTFCCCSLIDASLAPHHHLEDCQLRLLTEGCLAGRSDELSDTSSGVDAVGVAKKRKHRESMARLRHKLRTSIASLQVEERQLQRQLRRVIQANAPTASSSNSTNPIEKLQLAYYELVRGQIRLQDERSNLDQTQARQDKYERLLHREIERARTFRATPEDLNGGNY